jgi:hypothetical protein
LGYIGVPLNDGGSGGWNDEVENNAADEVDDDDDDEVDDEVEHLLNE